MGKVDSNPRRVLKAARVAGWRIRRSRDGWLLYPSDGSRAVPLHGGGQAKRNNKSQRVFMESLRKKGLDV